MEYITGEKLQEIADVSIALNITGNYDSDLVKTQLCNIKTKCFVFSEKTPITTLPNEIKTAKTIFVYSHILKYFLQHIYPLLNSPFTLISHNGDDGVDAELIQHLDLSKITKWFCQNRYIQHEKLFSLPIGLGNKQWPHGNLELFDQIRNSVTVKTNLVYKNFDTNTNQGKRSYCNTVTNANNIHMHPPCGIIENWTAIANSVYSIAPHGNGVDSHRIWECLYLNTIPVVEYHECFSQFTDLPILFVDDYSIVTREYLESQKNQFVSKNTKKLNINFWKNLITTIQ
jgi:hypothetical protein